MLSIVKQKFESKALATALKGTHNDETKVFKRESKRGPQNASFGTKINREMSSWRAIIALCHLTSQSSVAISPAASSTSKHLSRPAGITCVTSAGASYR